jgi:riboflavin synthase
MFTGLVEDVGTVIALSKTTSDASGEEGWLLVIRVGNKALLKDARLGDSIAVNGVCLTVTALDVSDHHQNCSFGCAPETMRRTNLGDLQEGDPVNLERSVVFGSRMGGHFVEGHVDGVGILQSKKMEGDSLWVTIKVEDERIQALMRFIVEKGYVAIDGTSLTVCGVGEDWFTFMLIDYTQQRIALPKKPVGSRINIEVDILAKYVAKVGLKVEARDVVEALHQHLSSF